MIKKVTAQDDFQLLSELLNDSFITVANEFGITKDNCPSHNAFINSETLKSKLTSNREFYRLEEDGNSIGFITIEKADKKRDTFYIEKVAVHPDHRHKGLGKRLMDFATKRIIESNGKKVSVSLIDSNKILKDWYKKQGYIETGTKVFDHLPFKVCFMDKELDILIK
jgi:ribosomal protein S18 acetylase RimI-like enzyme